MADNNNSNTACNKRDIIERHCGLNVWRWNLLNFNFLERHWVYLKDTDLTEVKETALEVNNLSFLHWWKKRNISIVKTIQKYKIKGMCSRELFRRSIHIQTCFVVWTQRHWRKKPLCLRSDGGGVVLSVCDCRALADSRSCFALLPFVWGASLGTVFTSAGVLFTSVSGTLLLSSTMILPLGEREKRSLSAVSLSPLFCLLLLFILFPRIGSPKNDCSVMIYSPSCSWQTWVSFYLSFFLSFFSETQKMDFDETEEYARYSF